MERKKYYFIPFLYRIDWQVYIYEDSAYFMRAWFQIGFIMAFATETQFTQIKAMISGKEAVEWSKKDLKQI